MLDNTHISPKSDTVLRNERLTALTGAVLFVLIFAELVVTAQLHALIAVHIFVGVLLSGPLVLKLCSTGYRFFRYYTKSPAFVRKGPPNIWLRLLAPVLVMITVLVFVSGFGLAVVGPSRMGLLITIHAASVAIWIPLIAVHIYAYMKKVPRLIRSDWSRKVKESIPGRTGRVAINIGALLAGIIAAVLMIPVSSSWRNWHIQHGLPSPLVAGVLAAIFAVLIAVPLLRKAR